VTGPAPGLVGQGDAAARRAAAQRDLELLVMEIAAAEQHLDDLRRREEELRAIAGS
jgi:hypothetical protein